MSGAACALVCGNTVKTMAMHEGSAAMTGILDWVGLSGVIALLAGAAGYGQLRSDVKALKERDTSQANQIAIARLEEQMKAIRDDVTDIKRAVVK